MESELDDLDFLILNTVKDSDEPLWKRRLTRLFNERGDAYQCLSDGVSPQTVGRRVDKLHDAGLLEEYGARPQQQTGILSAYRVTEGGVAALEEKQDAVLREYALQFSEHCLSDTATFSIPEERQRLLLDMLSAEFDVELDQLLDLRSEMNTVHFYRAVVCALALYYLKQHVPQHARGNPVLDLLKEESREYAEKLVTHVVPRNEEEQLLKEWDLT